MELMGPQEHPLQKHSTVRTGRAAIMKHHLPKGWRFTSLSTISSGFSISSLVSPNGFLDKVILQASNKGTRLVNYQATNLLGW